MSYDSKTMSKKYNFELMKEETSPKKIVLEIYHL